jgi:hypothetical protein
MHMIHSHIKNVSHMDTVADPHASNGWPIKMTHSRSRKGADPNIECGEQLTHSIFCFHLLSDLSSTIDEAPKVCTSPSRSHPVAPPTTPPWPPTAPLWASSPPSPRRALMTPAAALSLCRPCASHSAGPKLLPTRSTRCRAHRPVSSPDAVHQHLLPMPARMEHRLELHLFRLVLISLYMTQTSEWVVKKWIFHWR